MAFAAPVVAARLDAGDAASADQGFPDRAPFLRPDDQHAAPAQVFFFFLFGAPGACFCWEAFVLPARVRLEVAKECLSFCGVEREQGGE